MEFVDLAEAKQRTGLKLVVVAGIPSPWGEAAKSILHVKKIPFAAVPFVPGQSDGITAWTGCTNAPIAVYADEPPRSGWAEILVLAERLAPEPRLLPADPDERALCFGLCHELCGEMGFGWSRRLTGIHDAFTSDGKAGFSVPIAEYLAPRYGYRPDGAAEAHRRVLEVLRMLTRRLQAQKKAGSRYYLGDSLTALDIYSATFMVLIKPLPKEQCDIPDEVRQGLASIDPEIEKAADPILLEHRDAIYRDHLVLPLEL